MKRITVLILCLCCFALLFGCHEQEAAPPEMPANAGLANPVRTVDGPEAFESELGVYLQPPEGAQECSYAIISGQIAQIRFTCEELEYTLRAAYAEEDISGVFGPFAQQTPLDVAFSHGGQQYTLQVHYTTDGGALATCNLGRLRYSLYAPSFSDEAHFEAFAAEIFSMLQELSHPVPTSEGHLHITSGGNTFYPYMSVVYSKFWDGQNMISADGGVDPAALKEAEQLPMIPYSDDFTVTLSQEAQLDIILLYDEAFQRLDNQEDLDCFHRLESGTYYAEIVIKEYGDFIDQANAQEYAGLSCVFGLTIP